MGVFHFVFGALALFLGFFVIKYLFSTRKLNPIGACSNPSCVRCVAYRSLCDEGRLNRASSMFVEKTDRNPSTTQSRTIIDLISNGILKSKCLDDRQAPTLVSLPNLETAPFWKTNLLPAIVSFDLNHANVLGDFRNLEQKGAWAENSTERGRWLRADLVNQGVPNRANLALAPHIRQRIIESPDFRFWRNCFINVFFSVLTPNSEIEAHYGPTNMRIRAHYTVCEGRNARLTVCGKAKSWPKAGEWLAFDDSFEHSVKYAASPGMTRQELSDLPERVVLIVDLFHPALDDASKEYLEAVFRLEEDTYTALFA